MSPLPGPTWPLPAPAAQGQKVPPSHTGAILYCSRKESAWNLGHVTPKFRLPASPTPSTSLTPPPPSLPPQHAPQTGGVARLPAAAPRPGDVRLGDGHLTHCSPPNPCGRGSEELEFLPPCTASWSRPHAAPYRGLAQRLTLVLAGRLSRLMAGLGGEEG